MQGQTDARRAGNEHKEETFSNYPTLLTFKALNKIKSLVLTTFKVMKGGERMRNCLGSHSVFTQHFPFNVYLNKLT